MLRGDESLILRALQNLIGNSIRYAPGSLIQVRVYREGKWLRVDFWDTGPGIPPEVAAIVEGRMEDPSIHVMGLRVVRQIIRAHKGQMRFLSKGGKRNEVCLFLPLS